MRWQTKARAFSVLSSIPFGEDIHYALQRYVTRRLPRPKQVKSVYTLAQHCWAFTKRTVYGRYGIRPASSSAPGAI